jgi:hypothetical protein
MKYNSYSASSLIHGKGLFAKTFIPAGQKITFARGGCFNHSCNSNIISHMEAVCLIGAPLSDFYNHKLSKKLVNEILSLAWTARYNIETDEELTVNYFSDGAPVKEMICNCPSCRKKKVGNICRK